MSSARRKGQLEMIGIAIVVVLIVIGATIFLTLSIKPASKAHATFAQKELAQNIVDAIVKTVSECNDLDFASVLEDCAKSGEPGLLDCGVGRRSCEYASQEIATILDRILGVRKFEYRFSAMKDGTTPIFDDITTQSCTEALIRSGKVTVETPGIQPIPLYPGTLTLMLQICQPVK
jgi:hypothetical protein